MALYKKRQINKMALPNQKGYEGLCKELWKLALPELKAMTIEMQHMDAL